MDIKNIIEHYNAAFEKANMEPRYILDDSLSCTQVVHLIGLTLCVQCPQSVVKPLMHDLMHEVDPNMLADLGIWVNPEVVSVSSSIDPWLVLLDDQPRTVIQYEDIFPSVNYRGGSHATIDVRKAHVDCFDQAKVVAVDSFVNAYDVQLVTASGYTCLDAIRCASVLASEDVRLFLNNSYGEVTGRCRVTVEPGGRLWTNQVGGEITVLPDGMALLESDKVVPQGDGLIIKADGFSAEQLASLKDRMRVTKSVQEVSDWLAKGQLAERRESPKRSRSLHR